MRKLIEYTLVSADGVFAAPKNWNALGFCDQAYLRDGQLQHAAFGHGDAVEAVHERHGDVIVGDDDEARVGRARHFFREIADLFDILKTRRENARRLFRLGN